MVKFRDALVSRRHADDDILGEKQKDELSALIAEANEALKTADGTARFIAGAPERYGRIVPPLPHSALREWLDIIAVAMAVAFGIRGLFFQPFKIPTSSMQPTLYGIHFMERENSSNPLLGKLPAPVDGLLFSARPAKVVVDKDGMVNPDSLKRTGNFLFDSTSFDIAGRTYRLPGEPAKVLEYSGLSPYVLYKAGTKLCDGFLSQGDHLFVDRVGFHLTGLHRGDVTVFNTEGLVSGDGRKLMDLSGYYYIKRLAGLPGDTLKIVDRTLYVRPKGEKEFRKITEFSAKFDRLYSGKGGYQGHANSPGEGNISFYLRTPEEEYTVPDDHYFMLGDNTKFSADSRIFGPVPRRNIVGRAFVVFWPFSRRWGLADHAAALDIPTGESVRGTFPSMYYQ
ncbi:MAG: signal peptidase I [Victivallaceae bacterium]